MAGRSTPPRRSLWKRGADAAAFGITVIAGLLIANGATDKVRWLPHGFSSGRGPRSTPPSRESARLGYETEDMSARTMMLAIIGLGIFAAIASGAMIGMMAVFKNHTTDWQPLTAEQTARISPPGPHLQTRPNAEYRDAMARQDQLLNGYAWLDARHSVARIPISRAMQLSVGKSLDEGP